MNQLLPYAPLALNLLLLAWFGGRIVERLGAISTTLKKLDEQTVPRLHARIDEHQERWARLDGAAEERRRQRTVTNHGFGGNDAA